MLNHFLVLLEGIVAEPEQRLAELPLLSPAERRQLLIEWNNTAAPFPRDCCIHALFEAQAARTPDIIALETVEEQLTYAQLNRRADRIAAYLRASLQICREDNELEELVSVAGWARTHP